MKKFYTEDDEEMLLLWELQKYLEVEENIKIPYIRSLQDFLTDKGFITRAQLEMLEEIHKEHNVKEYIQKYVTRTYYDPD